MRQPVTLFRRLALATTLTTLGVIGVGGLVRATGSGDGCPDWPRCFGRWFPPLEKHALIEYSHRSIGAIAIALLILTAIVAVARLRHHRSLLVPTLIATPSILVQAVLGALVVHVKTTPSLLWLEPWFVTVHIATAMGLIALLVLMTVRAYGLSRDPSRTQHGRLPGAGVALAATLGLILVGAYVRGEHAGLAFADWPLMGGRLIPRLDGVFGIHFAHRATALAAGLVLAVVIARARRIRGRHPEAAWFALAAGGLFLVQAAIGGLQVITRLSTATVTAHVLLTGATWAALVAAATCARRLPARPQPQRRVLAPAAPLPISGGQVDVGSTAVPRPAVRARWLTTARAYVRLTKPRIIALLLITTLPTMALASDGVPSVALVALTLLGGTLAAGSANTINMVLDRDIDAIMARTRRRPLPSRQVPARDALIFGIVLAVASFALMVTTVNLPAALLAQGAIGFYVFVYTIGLKRSTPQNIVIGGAAGAVPVLVGWAAVTGSVGIEALVLFAVVFFWTPPHFWALALRYERDYASAGVPMMPVVAGAAATRRWIVAYTVITIAVSLALVPAAAMGTLYVAAAVALGGWFLGHAVVLLRDGTSRAAMATFQVSILYLALLFVAVGVDALLR